jgi:hypothetical protein
LLLAVGGNLLQRVGIDPDALALAAFEQTRGSDRHGLHADLTAWAKQCFAAREFAAVSFSAAVRAELCTCKHRLEARRARDRCENSVAKVAAG